MTLRAQVKTCYYGVKLERVYMFLLNGTCLFFSLIPQNFLPVEWNKIFYMNS